MICKKCGLEKDRCEFYSSRKTCKVCHKKIRKIYYAENKERQLKKMQEYYCANKAEIASWIQEYHKRYYEQNKDKIKKAVYTYRAENPEKIKKARNLYQNKRRNDDAKFKLRSVISTAVYKALKRRKSAKNNKLEMLLGYTISDLMSHLERLFAPEMTWENYGSYWHVDHVKPDSWFDYIDSEDEKFKECWALKNLQPLTAKNNYAKGNRFEG